MSDGGDGTVLVLTIVTRITDGRVSVGDACVRALQEGKIVPVKITLKLLRNAMVGGWGGGLVGWSRREAVDEWTDRCPDE